jgi:hypothetical protein
VSREQLETEQGEIDYLLRLQANRTEAEGERALYRAVGLLPHH